MGTNFNKHISITDSISIDSSGYSNKDTAIQDATQHTLKLLDEHFKGGPLWLLGE